MLTLWLWEYKRNKTVVADLLVGHNSTTIHICSGCYVFQLFPIDENTDLSAVGCKISNSKSLFLLK